MSNDTELLAPQIRLDCMVLELQNGLINDLYWLFKESNNYDALINVGSSPNIKSFKAHTSILSARSLYFRAILSNSHPSGKGSLIGITQTNIEPDIFDVILKFLYIGRISLENVEDVKILFEYIIAAEKLWLYKLIQYIENYLIYEMNDWLKSNFIYVLITINTNSSSFRLLHEFVNDMLKNHSYLLFDSKDFHIIPENILIQLLQHRKFSDEINEEKIWNFLLNWGIKQNIDDLSDKDIRDWTSLDFNKLQNSLQHCIPLIRFTDIPPKIFYDIIEPYKEILTTELYQRTMQSPTFVKYNKSMLPSSPTYSIESFSSIPTPLLDAFPMPPSPVSSSINELTSRSRSKSTVNRSILKTNPESSITRSNSITSSTATKSKNKIKENNISPIKKSDDLLTKITNSVLPTWKSTYLVRRKPKSTSISVYSVKTSENTTTSLPSIIKRPNTTILKKSDFTSSEPVIELEASLRKMRRRFNRKTSIISYSKSSTTPSFGFIPRNV